MTMSVDVKYRTTASGGCEGQAWMDDGRLEVQLSTPKELGGAGGGGSNPEQLFGAGYAACFLTVLKGLAHQVEHRAARSQAFETWAEIAGTRRAA